MALASGMWRAEGGVARFVANVREAMARRKLFHDTLQELQDLSNGELKEIGVSRSAIRQVAFETAYGTEKQSS